jgi:peptidoglycan-N-acetylglucosamine deacetylase
MTLRSTAATIIISVAIVALVVVRQWSMASGQESESLRVAGRPAQCAGHIALTFDDGPDALLTPQFLDILDAYGVHATFFVVGSHIEGNEQIIERMDAQGHSVQNHTWDHPYLTQLTTEEIERQLEMTNETILKAGAPEPEFGRPPYGDYDARVTGAFEAQGLQVTTWTNVLDIRDWDGPASSEQIVERVRVNLQDGGVVLLHDVQPNTLEALPEIIDAVHQEGYCFAPFQGEADWLLNA